MEGQTKIGRHSGRGVSGTHDVVVAATLTELAPHIDAWLALEGRAVEDNFYMTAPFVSAAFRHNRAGADHRVVFVYDRSQEPKALIGCAAFTVVRTRVRPTTLSTLIHPFGYLSQPLLDRDLAVEAFQAIWDWVEAPARPWALAVLHRMRGGSPVTRLIKDDLGRRGRAPWLRETFSRVLLKRRESFDGYLTALSKNRRKRNAAQWRRLQAEGLVETVIHRDLTVAPDLACRTMDLEKEGWKGDEGTAMAQDVDQKAFFEDVTGAFGARGRLLFIELKLNGRPIAISSNFIVGTTLFGFKIAYDPHFASYSPGVLAEVEVIKSFHQDPDLRMGDSGTLGKSYLDPWWNEPGEIEVLYVATRKLRGVVYLAALRALSRLKRWLVGRWSWLGTTFRRGKPITNREADDEQ